MPVSLDVLTATGAKAGRVTLPEAIFEAPINLPLIHQVVVAQLAAARQGTHATKTRAEVSGGGRKPWRQKGTGRARQGSRRAPQWVGGGTVHGPQPRSYAQRTPKKMVAAALRSVLSDRVADGRLFVLTSLLDGDVPSTKQALTALGVVGDYRSALVVLHRDEDLVWLSLRNVPYAHAIAVDQLNVYDVVNNQCIVFTTAALVEYLERLGVYDPELIEIEIEAELVDEIEAELVDELEAEVEAELVDELVDEVEAELEAAAEDDEAKTETKSKPKDKDKAKSKDKVKDDEPKAKVVEPAEPAAKKTAPKPLKAPKADEVPADDVPADKPDYGEGSYRGTNPPEGYDIKGNEDSMKFHTPDSPWYKRTVAEIWFNSPQAALDAGFADVMEGKK